MLTVAQAAFAVAYFLPLSEVHECSDNLNLNGSFSPGYKQPTGYKSQHDWLVRLGMDVAVLCVMWS